MPDYTNSTQSHELILKEQTQLLYSSLPIANLFYLLIGGLLFWLIGAELGFVTIIPWLACLLLSLLIRHAIYLEYKNTDPKTRLYSRWQIIHIIFCSCFSAAIWSLLSLLFFFKISNSLQITLLFTLVSLCTSAMPVLLSVKMINYALYLLIMIAPIFTQILIYGSGQQKTLILLASLLILTFTIISRYLSRAFTDSMHYRTESEHLSERLRAANARLSLLNEDLERLSVTDDLTGIANRRYFNKRFAETWADHIRESKPLSALMIDVDYFKNFNDHYGHLEGDKCLRSIAETIHNVIFRPRDFIARYGGEEFIILLPNTSRIGAEQVAERIHARIQELKIENKPNGISGYLTVSIGITEETPTTSALKSDFLNRVDNALYQAKKIGRNTTYFQAADTSTN